MELVDISGTLTTLVADFTTQITAAAPIILGAIVLVAGVNLGLKWVKKLTSKIG